MRKVHSPKRRIKKLNARDLRKMKVRAAMPAVKRLVKQFGREIVANCLGRIHAHEKETKKLVALKKQVAQMERTLR